VYNKTYRMLKCVRKIKKKKKKKQEKVHLMSLEQQSCQSSTYYYEFHEILELMKYSSRSWTAQMPQLFCGGTKQKISVLHEAQRGLKSPPPGTGTASKPKGPFFTSQFVISEKLAISKPALYCFGLCLCKAWNCRDPLLCHFAHELCEYFCS